MTLRGEKNYKINDASGKWEGTRKTTRNNGTNLELVIMKVEIKGDVLILVRIMLVVGM